MSFPIPPSVLIRPTALVRQATRLAGDVAGRVSQAIGFDEVLRGAGQADDPQGSVDQASLRNDLVDAIQAGLSRLGLIDSQGAELTLSEGGQLRVTGNHPRGAEIEAFLNADPDVVGLASQLNERMGSQEAGRRFTISIGLTSPGMRRNILPSSGGYPNW